MGKRASSVCATKPAKAAKVVNVGPVKELSSKVAKFLSTGSNETKAAIDTVVPMIPLALAPQSEQHEYQAWFVTTLAKLTEDVVAVHRAAAEQATADGESLPSDQATAAAMLQAATDKRAVKEQVRDDLEAARNETATRASDALAKLHEAKRSAASLLDEVAAATVQKDALEKLHAGSIGALKAGSFNGKEWRVRDKLLAQVLKELSGLGGVDSLNAGLAVALKAKPEERESFDAVCIEAAEDLVKGRISTCENLLASQAEEGTRRAAAEERAAEEDKKASEASEASQEELNRGKAEVSEAKVEQSACEKKVKELAVREGKSTAHIAQRRDQLEKAVATKEAIAAAVALLTANADEPAAEPSAPEPVAEPAAEATA